MGFNDTVDLFATKYFNFFLKPYFFPYDKKNLYCVICNGTIYTAPYYRLNGTIYTTALCGVQRNYIIGTLLIGSTELPIAIPEMSGVSRNEWQSQKWVMFPEMSDKKFPHSTFQKVKKNFY